MCSFQMRIRRNENENNEISDCHFYSQLKLISLEGCTILGSFSQNLGKTSGAIPRRRGYPGNISLLCFYALVSVFICLCVMP